MAGVVGVLAAVALVAAPGALANGDTITAQATVPFSGVVDCLAVPAHPASRHDRLGRQHRDARTGTSTRRTIAVSGTHTYATRGTYSGTIFFSGGNCTSGATDNFTANVSAPPRVHGVPASRPKQRLPVPDHGQQRHRDGASGHQPGALRGGGRLADRRAEQLVASPVSQLPLAVPGSGLFGFEGDGICNPGGPPVPSGCAPQAGTAAGTDCTQGLGGTCAFPGPPVSPPATSNPGAPPESRRTATRVRPAGSRT